MISHQDILIRYANNATTREDIEVLIKALGFVSKWYAINICDPAQVSAFMNQTMETAIKAAQS